MKVKIWFPEWSQREVEKDVSIPPDVNPDEWLDNHKEDIIYSAHCDLDGRQLSSAIDLGYAGVKRI